MKSILLKTLICGLFLVFSSNFVSAQENLPLVTVTGKGEVKVAPDEVAIRFGVVKIDDTPEAASRGVDSIFKQINTLVSRYNINPSQKSIDYLRLEVWPPDQLVTTPRRKIRAEQGMTIVLKDISMYQGFLSELYKTGINRIDNVEFRTSELRKHQDEARELAVKAAREKAEALAKSLGQSIGAAYSIEEFPENNFPMMRMANQSMNGDGAAESFGQIPITANVTVKFYLK
ncbi:MAG: SIMPL domain-containing protein [Bacteroidota bacterium]